MPMRYTFFTCSDDLVQCSPVIKGTSSARALPHTIANATTDADAVADSDSFTDAHALAHAVTDRRAHAGANRRTDRRAAADRAALSHAGIANGQATV